MEVVRENKIYSKCSFSFIFHLIIKKTNRSFDVMGETDDNNNGSSTDHVLSFTDLKFSVGNEQQACGVSFLTSAKNNKKNKKKLIIDSISGRVQCGQMVSVMGPR